jgi:hypothetical protein
MHLIILRFSTGASDHLKLLCNVLKPKISLTVKIRNNLHLQRSVEVEVTCNISLAQVVTCILLSRPST